MCATFETPNFEHVIHALELLEPLVASAFYEKVVDEYRPVLGAFLEGSRKYESLLDSGLLNFTRFSVMKSIMSEVSSRVCSRGPSPERELAILFKRLCRDFSLSIFTLNYDDLVDRTGGWFDGFINPTEESISLPFQTFDRNAFIARAVG